MDIISMLAELRSKERYDVMRRDAPDIFSQQVNAIGEIKQTKGFQEIKNYWMRVVESCVERLKTCNDLTELAKVQSALTEATQFLSFLDNLANATVVDET